MCSKGVWRAGQLPGYVRVAHGGFFRVRFLGRPSEGFESSPPDQEIMTKKENIQGRVAETMMQVPATVKIGGRTYEVAPPSFGTLELVSAKLAEVPDIGDLGSLSSTDKAVTMLRKAKDFGVLPDLLAILILGSKHIRDNEKVAQRRRKRGLLGFFGATEEVAVETSALDRLTTEIRDEVSPAQMAELVPFLIGSLQLTDFFVLTTFLREITVAEPTKVEKKTTAPGPSSRASSKRST